MPTVSSDPSRRLGLLSLANDLMDIGATATAGIQISDPAQSARLKDADTANGAIAEPR